jgi:hypothetical protein
MMRLKTNAGSALLVTLPVTVIFLTVGSQILLTVQQFRSASARNAAWTEALCAAQSGIDIALTRLNSGIKTGFDVPNVTQRTGEGGSTAEASVTLDEMTIGGTASIRIRSSGIVQVPGTDHSTVSSRTGAGGTVDRLRQFYFYRMDNAPVARPVTRRTIEVYAVNNGVGWKYAIETNDWVRVQGSSAYVDSYNSKDPTKSSTINGIPGQYDPAKRQQNGTVATNSHNSGDVQLVGKFYGNVLTNGVNLTPLPITSSQQPQNGQVRLTGTVNSKFNEPMAYVQAPAWSSWEVYPSGNDLQSGDRTLVAGLPGAPKRYQFTEANRKMTITLPPGQTSGSIEVWVTGNINNGGIDLAKGVDATIYFQNGLSISGSSIVNRNRNAASLKLLGYRASGSSAININGGGDLWAIIYAPQHDMSLSGGQRLYGSFATKSLVANNTVEIHYDEALGNGSSSSNYQVVSWVEDSY